MPLLQILVMLIIIGVVLWLVETYIPMSPPIRTLIRVLVVLFICLWLLQIFGLLWTGPVVTPHR